MVRLPRAVRLQQVARRRPGVLVPAAGVPAALLQRVTLLQAAAHREGVAQEEPAQRLPVAEPRSAERAQAGAEPQPGSKKVQR